MALIGGLPTGPVDVLQIDKQRKPSLTGLVTGWLNFMNAVQMICNALTMSGTTAQRPTGNLWPGRMYFDVSLGTKGKPIWVNKAGTGWVLADGTGA